jgi:hypothetical protein
MMLLAGLNLPHWDRSRVETSTDTPYNPADDHEEAEPTLMNLHFE